MRPSFKETELSRDNTGRRSRVNSMHRIQEISKRMRAKRGPCVGTAGPSPAEQAFLRNPPEIGLGGTGLDRQPNTVKVGTQHRNRQQAPVPQGLTGVNEGESMSTVGCTSIEPANKNIPITTHAPPRALDPAPPNPPPPTTPEGGMGKWRHPAVPRPASLGTKQGTNHWPPSREQPDHVNPKATMPMQWHVDGNSTWTAHGT